MHFLKQLSVTDITSDLNELNLKLQESNHLVSGIMGNKWVSYSVTNFQSCLRKKMTSLTFKAVSNQ